MRRYFIAFLLMMATSSLPGHVGSPGVTFEGLAGEYSLMVQINPPEVIPGIASVDVYIQAPGDYKVLVKPVYWFAGAKGTPRADEAVPILTEPGHYQAQLWLMSSGTSSVEIEVHGDLGIGKVVVPVMAVSTAKKAMSPQLGWSLGLLGLLLVVLMVTIISLSMSDSLQKENTANHQKVVRNRRMGMIISSVLIALILWGGKSWWDSWAGSYDRYMYQPWQANSTVIAEDSVHRLNFQLAQMNLPSLYLTRNIGYIVPDHGKIMHMFLVKEGTLEAFAHIHPKRLDSLTFETALPPLPAGRYFIYADITRLSGFSETIVDTVDIPEPLLSAAEIQPFMNVDDTYFITDSMEELQPFQAEFSEVVICGSPGKETLMPDSSKVVWELPENGQFNANTLYSLTFTVEEPNGGPAQLEPYLGMMGHAVVLKKDAQVYIHLHPVGNYSTTSQQILQARIDANAGRIDWDGLPKPALFADSIDQWIEELELMPATQREALLSEGMDHDWEDPDHPDHAVVKFPYSFPSAGEYRIFIQMKRNGRILNSAFDVQVQDQYEL